MSTIRSAFRNICRKKTRTAMIVLGVAIGVFSIVLINGISTNGKEAISTQINGMGLYGLSVRFEDTNSGLCFSQSDVQLVQKNVPDAEVVMPLSVEYRNVQAAGQQTGCAIWGVDADAEEVLDLTLLYGKPFSAEQVRKGERICLVGEDYAEAVFGRKNVVGKTIGVEYNDIFEEFTIWGVLKSSESGLQELVNTYVPSFIYLPNQAIYDITGSSNTQRMAIKVREDVDSDLVTEKIVRLLEMKFRGQSEFVVEDINEQKESFDGILSTVTLILTVIGGVSLVVSGLSIMTVMLVTVRERTKEIGIKKSIGASNQVILLEFLAEALLVTLTGSLIGSALGVAGCYLGGSLYNIAITMDPGMLLKINLFAVIVGVAFGVVPAMKAARLKPLEALHAD